MVLHDQKINNIIKANGIEIPGLKFTCSRCHKVGPNNTGILPVDNNHENKICIDCARKRYNLCDKCCKFFIGRCKCEGPAQDNRNANLIHYAFINDWKIFGDAGEPTFGVEIEAWQMKGSRTINAVAGELNKKYSDIAKVKHDGSIRDKRGLEVVLSPMTYSWMIQNSTRIEQILKDLKANGFVAAMERTCAGHVHYSAQDITNKQLIRIEEYFINHPGVMRVISRRQRYGHHWDIGEATVRAAETFSSRRNRYINYNNVSTVELRFLAGITSLHHFFYNVEITDAIMEFGKKKSTGRNSGPGSFKSFVRGNRQKWPNAWEYLKNVRNSL